MHKKIVLILASILIAPFSGWSEVENIDEMVMRKITQPSANWGYQYLEEFSNNFYWQPETLSYTDLKTGHEVWRMSNTTGLGNIYHNDIGVTPWSADGKRLAFTALDRDTGAFERDGWNIWMIVNSNGSQLRPIINGPARVNVHTPYFHWSPQISDTYYQFGRTRAGNSGVQSNILYKGTVSGGAIAKSALIGFPTTKSTELFLNKTISGDGKKVIAMPWYENWWYPATIYPDSSAGLDDPDGCNVDRNMDSRWGDTPSSYSKLHDQYYAGDGSWIFVLPSGTHAWWRIKVLGSAPDGGSIYSFTSPDKFGEQWPENTVDSWGGTQDPFGSDYWSHFVPDRWGRYALYSNSGSSYSDPKGPGPGIWDIKNHKDVVLTFGGGAQHHDWHGFTDWTISTRGPEGADYSNDRIYVQRFDDPNSQQTVCYTHTLYNNGGVYAGAGYEYSALPRPGQSPDGTKVAFHSTFLNAKGGDYDNRPDIYWAVAYYPYPPEITHTTATSGTVKVKFDWRLDTANPRGYTTRGWPDEGKDIPPAPRETKLFRLWRSSDNLTWMPVGTTDANIFDRFDFANGGFKPGQPMYWEIADNPGAGTWYYAVTNQEHSGLESHTLSNVWKVTLDSSGNITESVQEVVYPSDPGGVKPFYTALPPAPTNFGATKKSTPGHYQLTWNEPNNSLIRYYNIYYSTTSTPPADQRYRIASIPVGHAKWLDWNADPARDAYYRITSVDFQGNEGDAPGANGPRPDAPTDLRVIEIRV